MRRRYAHAKTPANTPANPRCHQRDVQYFETASHDPIEQVEDAVLPSLDRNYANQRAEGLDIRSLAKDALEYRQDVRAERGEALGGLAVKPLQVEGRGETLGGRFVLGPVGFRCLRRAQGGKQGNDNQDSQER